jgi:hypothetical protein
VPRSSKYEVYHSGPRQWDNVEAGSHVYTDEAVAYFGLSADYAHDVINHAECYVDGQIHTIRGQINALINFSPLKTLGAMQF